MRAGLRVEFAQRPELKAILFYAADATLTNEFLDKGEAQAFEVRDQLFAEDACGEESRYKGPRAARASSRGFQ